MSISIASGFRIFETQNISKIFENQFNLFKETILKIFDFKVPNTLQDMMSILNEEASIDLVSEDRLSTLEIELLDNDLRFYLNIKDALVLNLKEVIYKAVIDYFILLCENPSNKWQLLDRIGVYTPSEDFPKLRPPLQMFDFHWDNAITVFTPENLKVNFFSDQEEVFLLLNEKDLPEDAKNVKRIKGEGYVIFSWIDDFTDFNKWREMSKIHQVWIKENFSPPLLPRFNSDGDEIVMPMGFDKNEFVMFYSKVLKSLCQSFTVTDNEVNEVGIWNEIKKIKSIGKLPNGDELNQVYILVPTRDDALKIKRKSDEAGFEAVFYPDDNGKWWNPFPPGYWITE